MRDDNLVETIEYRGFNIKVYQDTDVIDSPDEWGDDEIFLVGYHRDFTVERKNVISKDQAKLLFGYTSFKNFREHYVDMYVNAKGGNKIIAIDNIPDKVKTVRYTFKQAMDYYGLEDYDVDTVKDFFSKYWIFGLEAYIHSGVVLALSYEGNFCDRRWDVSQLGLVLVSKKMCRLRKRAKESARTLISSWNDYLSGNVYGFVCEDDNEERIDSCWGFYGDWEKSGLLEDAKSNIDYEIKKRVSDHAKQVKEWVRNKVPIQYRKPFYLTGEPN